MAAFEFNLTQFDTSVMNEEKVQIAGKLATQQEVIALTEAIANAMKDEFSNAGHNRTGETLDSIETHVGPMHANITMAGGSSYVEYGFPGHYIEATNARALHWEGDEKFSEGFARPGIWVSGYAGDPFVERAIDDIDLGKYLQNVAEKIFVAVVAEGGANLKMVGLNITEDNSAALASTDRLAASEANIASNTNY